MAWRAAWLVAFCASLFLSFSAAQEGDTTCKECDEVVCPAVEECPSGVVKDRCGCCDVCARGLGQLCDLEGVGAAVYGTCGEYLHCAARTDLQDSKEATCQCKETGEVCGSDAVTYPTLCHLLDRAPDIEGLHVAARGPCMAAPTIRSRPEDKTRPLGSILVLDCEASGHPVPTITWHLNKLDGSSLELPGDDPAFAVQVRGGPENNMVTGWVQIMKITEENLGIYTCLAKNSEGEAQASATVTELKPDSKENKI